MTTFGLDYLLRNMYALEACTNVRIQIRPPRQTSLLCDGDVAEISMICNSAAKSKKLRDYLTSLGLTVKHDGCKGYWTVKTSFPYCP